MHIHFASLAKSISLLASTVENILHTLAIDPHQKAGAVEDLTHIQNIAAEVSAVAAIVAAVAEPSTAEQQTPVLQEQPAPVAGQ